MVECRFGYRHSPVQSRSVGHLDSCLNISKVKINTTIIFYYNPVSVSRLFVVLWANFSQGISFVLHHDINIPKVDYFLFLFVLQLSQREPYSEDETMVPVLTSKKASELPVNEVVCVLQVRLSCHTDW